MGPSCIPSGEDKRRVLGVATRGVVSLLSPQKKKTDT